MENISKNVFTTRDNTLKITSTSAVLVSSGVEYNVTSELIGNLQLRVNELSINTPSITSSSILCEMLDEQQLVFAHQTTPCVSEQLLLGETRVHSEKDCIYLEKLLALVPEFPGVVFTDATCMNPVFTSEELVKYYLSRMTNTNKNIIVKAEKPNATFVEWVLRNADKQVQIIRIIKQRPMYSIAVTPEEIVLVICFQQGSDIEKLILDKYPHVCGMDYHTTSLPTVYDKQLKQRLKIRKSTVERQSTGTTTDHSPKPIVSTKKYNSTKKVTK